MKLLTAILFLSLSFLSRADGLDEVTISLNGKKLKTVNFYDKDPLILDSLKTGDTLKFECFTDWGGELGDAFISYTTDGSGVTRLKLFPGYSYRKYYLVVSENLVDKTLSFIFHYDSKSKIEPWEFITIKPS